MMDKDREIAELFAALDQAKQANTLLLALLTTLRPLIEIGMTKLMEDKR